MRFVLGAWAIIIPCKATGILDGLVLAFVLIQFLDLQRTAEPIGQTLGMAVFKPLGNPRI